jgi:citrate lyase subunit beta/citryl-CoA lyase
VPAGCPDAHAANVNGLRSLLFVPANRPDLAAKANRSLPDAVVLDLEDAVPAAEKPAARFELAAAVSALRESGTTVLVRVNPPATPWFTDDVHALPDGVAGVVVPKFEPSSHPFLAQAGLELPVVAGLETVRGVFDAREALIGPVAGCYFGAEDYVVDLGGVRRADNAEVQVARSMVAMAARLAAVPAYDMIVVDFGDTERFKTEAIGARSLGYAGKLCIHPAQVPVANEAFVPSAGEIDRATELLAAYDEAVALGRATIAFEGTMVDEVVAKQARALLSRTSHRLD